MKKNIVLTGSLWTSTSTITTAIVQILRLSILAHFLEKSDFGVVAILTLVLGFTGMFSELGFSTIIMNRKNLTDKEFSSLYWLQFILYTFIYFVITSFSFLVADFFNEPSIRHLLPITMLDLIFVGIGRLYDTIIQKELKFKVLAKRNIIASFISLAVAIGLAYNGAGVYSLIISTIIQTLILNTWNLLQGIKSMPLKFYCSFKLIRPLFSMGINMTGAHILDYISTKIDVFIIGKMLGSETLGIYNLAKELVLKGTMLVNSIVNRVSIPLFAKKQDDKEALKRNYCKLVSFISLINFPVSTIIGVLGCIIVPILYGETYSDVISIVYILSTWAMINSIGNPVGNIVIATGRTDLSLKYTMIRLICYVPCIYVVSTYNITVLAWGTTALALISTFLSWYMQIYKTIELKLSQFIGSFGKPLLYTIIAGALGYIALQSINSNELGYTILLLTAALWCILFAATFCLIEKKTIKSILQIIKK
ncbi:MAG: MOP flippase family protein [Bacteroidaceae bacterium]|nr:MOP flippase family protein [Bacteroidaceae bacterium]